MDEKTVRDLLFQLKIPVQRHSYSGSKERTRWLNISCPFAPFTHQRGSDTNPSFGITINDAGKSNYKCLACGLKGRLSALPSRLGGYRKEDYSRIRHWAEMAELQATISKPVVDWENDHTHDEQKDEHRHTKPSHEAVMRYPRIVSLPYLRERGIRWPTPLTLGLRFDSYQSRILFPCYDRHGAFAGFTGRSVRHPRTYSKKNPKVRDYLGLDKRQLFLRLPGRRSGPKIISEGLIDFAKVVQTGFPYAHAILGTALTPEKIDILIEGGDPVYFFMDNDLAGWQALFGVFNGDGELEVDNAWAFRLYREVPVWIVPYDTPLDGTDPGSLDEKTIRRMISNAWLFMGNPPLDDLMEPHLMLP